MTRPPGSKHATHHSLPPDSEPTHPFPQDAGYTTTFWFLTGAAVLAALAAVIIPSVRPNRRPQRPVAESAPAARHTTSADAGEPTVA